MLREQKRKLTLQHLTLKAFFEGSATEPVRHQI